MLHTIIPPHEPQRQKPVHPAMMFIERQLTWEYKQIVRNLESEEPLDESELNELGAEGWEMSGIAHQASSTYFCFKRPVEK